MSNQYTSYRFNDRDIDNIKKMYQDGNSFATIALYFRCKRDRIKKILIENNLFIDGRDLLKKNFTEIEINGILLHYNNGLSCQKIANFYNVSTTPIKRILRDNNVLRQGYSNGIKIELTEDIKENIKRLYITELKTPIFISEVLNLNIHFIEKYIKINGFGRTKGESISLRQTGKKRSENVCDILKTAQQTFAKSGNRIQSGGTCKTFTINGIKCTGTYEKFYIEKLMVENQNLPTNSISVNTPFGVYYPDFSFNTRFIEIKSDYTYDVLIGKKINRWSKKIDTTQLKKIKWVNKNITPVDILVVDKKNNKIIKK